MKIDNSPTEKPLTRAFKVLLRDLEI